jgi:UDP-2,3-diacylglucosamine pyrophosphatase LpxH
MLVGEVPGLEESAREDASQSGVARKTRMSTRPDLEISTAGDLAIARIATDPVKERGGWAERCELALAQLGENATVRDVIVDLDRREWIPAEFEAALSSLHTILESRGGRLVVCGLCPQMAQTFRANGLERTLTITTGVATALALLRGSEPRPPTVLLPTPPTPGADVMADRRVADPTSMESIAPAEPEAPNPYECIVISDLHLGSVVCQAKLLEDFLEWACANAKQLVINGDIFDDLNFKRLSKRHFACLKVIRRNSDREDFRLIWIRGNHDGPVDIISHIVGVEILDEYIYDNGEVQLLILHGDQFDTFITKHVWLTEIGCGIFYYIQKYAPHQAARWVRRISKRWQRNSQLVERRAIEMSRARGCKYVTCGHTHLALTSFEDGVHYFNTGTWTEHPPCPFLTVRGRDVSLEYWPQPEREGIEPGAEAAASSETLETSGATAH